MYHTYNIVPKFYPNFKYAKYTYYCSSYTGAFAIRSLMKNYT